MADMKHTRTFDKLRSPDKIVRKVREWAQAKDLCREDASVVKVIGTKEQVEELDALVAEAGEKGDP